MEITFRLNLAPSQSYYHMLYDKFATYEQNINLVNDLQDPETCTLWSRARDVEEQLENFIDSVTVLQTCLNCLISSTPILIILEIDLQHSMIFARIRPFPNF